ERFVQVPEGLPRNARYLALTVAGDSMTPLMHSDDVVLVKLGQELARDAIVVAWHPDHGYVVKCVGNLRGGGVELLSVNPEFPPITILRQPSLILGTVLARWCAHEVAEGGETPA
ncbi:MAG: S24 family peptidase, partial [Gemmatimonadaceae bacterium]